MNTKSYEDIPGIGKTGQVLRQFGERQNDINQQLSEQLELLANQLGEALQRIAVLETENKALQARTEQLEKQNEEMQKDIDRLRLTTKLNSNALDRLAKQGN